MSPRILDLTQPLEGKLSHPIPFCCAIQTLGKTSCPTGSWESETLMSQNHTARERLQASGTHTRSTPPLEKKHVCLWLAWLCDALDAGAEELPCGPGT